MDRPRNIDRLSDPFDVAIIGGGATGLGAAVEAACARLPDGAPRGQGLRPGHLQPLHQAGARRGAVPGAGERRPRPGSAARAWPAPAERAAPGGRPRVRGPRVRVVVRPVLRAWGSSCTTCSPGGTGWGRASSSPGRRCWSASPPSEPDQLKGGVRYFDGQFDDARLAVTLALTADELGAVLVNHAAVVALTKAGGKVRGVRVRDEESGASTRSRPEWSSTRPASSPTRCGGWTSPARGAGGSVAGRAPRAPRCVPARSARPDDSEDRRRPGAVRRPLAQEGAARDHRHPGLPGERGAPAAGGGDRVPPRSRRPVPRAATPRPRTC